MSTEARSIHIIEGEMRVTFAGVGVYDTSKNGFLACLFAVMFGLQEGSFMWFIITLPLWFAGLMLLDWGFWKIFGRPSLTFSPEGVRTRGTFRDWSKFLGFERFTMNKKSGLRLRETQDQGGGAEVMIFRFCNLPVEEVEQYLRRYLPEVSGPKEPD